MSDANPYVDPSGVPPQKPVMTSGLGLTDEERTWGMLAHISPFIAGIAGLPFLGPLVVWMIYKEKSEFVSDQAKESLNFQLTVLIAILIFTATCVGIIVLPVIVIGALVYQIIAAMEANKGVLYRYPYTIRMIK
jgi:uncharacterized Tic20 family protein